MSKASGSYPFWLYLPPGPCHLAPALGPKYYAASTLVIVLMVWGICSILRGSCIGNRTHGLGYILCMWVLGPLPLRVPRNERCSCWGIYKGYLLAASSKTGLLRKKLAISQKTTSIVSGIGLACAFEPECRILLFRFADGRLDSHHLFRAHGKERDSASALCALC